MCSESEEGGVGVRGSAFDMIWVLGIEVGLWEDHFIFPAHTIIYQRIL